MPPPRNDDDRSKLRWIAEHYPVEAVRQEATLLLTAIRCTAKPGGKACTASARRRCYLCERAICGRHSVKVRSDLGGSYHVCLIYRGPSTASRK
jgi:hypothetical protein